MCIFIFDWSEIEANLIVMDIVILLKILKQWLSAIQQRLFAGSSRCCNINLPLRETRQITVIYRPA